MNLTTLPALCFLVILAIILAGCATTPPPVPVQTTISGPTFARADFRCGVKPLPPDPDAQQTGRDAARYENTLGAWGQRCAIRLDSVGRRLGAAGQVEGER